MTSSDVTSGLARAKRLARRLMDRVAEPYVTDSVRRVVESLSTDQTRQPSPATPPVVLHAALHEGRSIALADMPPGAEVVLSAGANGLWYFEWFDQEYGPVKHHIGVEAYMPRPDGLPDNVEWVEADLAAPAGVAAVGTGSVDLVFSGQNLEHLWPDQTVAFLVESNRVLRDDGLLVVDSPNRALTEAYQWSMAEHTVELEPSEAVNLLGLAGFAVERMKGVWLCREAGRLLPLDPTSAMFGAGGYARRVAMATAASGGLLHLVGRGAQGRPAGSHCPAPRRDGDLRICVGRAGRPCPTGGRDGDLARRRLARRRDAQRHGGLRAGGAIHGPSHGHLRLHAARRVVRRHKVGRLGVPVGDRGRRRDRGHVRAGGRGGSRGPDYVDVHREPGHPALRRARAPVVLGDG